MRFKQEQPWHCDIILFLRKHYSILFTQFDFLELHLARGLLIFSFINLRSETQWAQTDKQMSEVYRSTTCGLLFPSPRSLLGTDVRKGRWDRKGRTLAHQPEHRYLSPSTRDVGITADALRPLWHFSFSRSRSQHHGEDLHLRLTQKGRSTTLRRHRPICGHAQIQTQLQDSTWAWPLCVQR